MAHMKSGCSGNKKVPMNTKKKPSKVKVKKK